MTLKLNISPDIKIPLDIATQAVCIFGIRGAGKTNTASVMAEELLRAHVPIAIIDPTDAWWGLRSSRDGKGEGFPVFIFGGSHGDVPLKETDGRVVAEFVAKEGLPVIVSLRHLRKAAQRRFVREFCEELYHLKGKDEHRSPLTVFIDEAPLFVPKNPLGDVAFTVGAVEDLVARGRNVGFGVVLIGQRPVAVNADVRSIADTIITHRITGPLDRKEFSKWLEENATVEKMDEVLGSLPSLKDGEAWFWSGALGITTRAQVRYRDTFDSSKTPKIGTKIIAPKRLAEVDVEALKRRMASNVAEAEANDPKALRARVAELSKQLAAAQKAQAAPKPATVDPAQVEAIRHQAKLDAASGLASIIAGRANLIRDMGIDIAATVKEKFAEHERFMREVVSNTVKAVEANRPTTVRTPPVSPTPARRSAPAAPVAIDGLTKAQARIMESLAWLVSIGIERPSAKAVGLLSRIDPTGGYFSNTIGPLCSQGLVERSSGEVRLTDAGLASVEIPASVTLADYHARVRETLTQCRTGKTAEMFDALVANGPGEMTAESLGTAVGVDHTGGYFSNNVGPLATLGLIERSRGQIRTTDIMFPEGLA